MRRLWAVSCFLAMSALSLAGPSGGQADPIRLPVAPVNPVPQPPTEITKLGPDQWYVIDSDTPCLVLASPVGVVRVTEEAGPVKMRGKFVDGNGNTETRSYRGKHVFTVEAVAKGRVELLIVPNGASKEAEVIRRTLDVNGGGAPEPQPIEGKVAWVIVVEETSARTPAVALLLNDLPMWERIKAKGAEYRIYDKDSDDAKRKNYPQMVADVGLPAVLLLDAAGKKLKSVKLPATVAELEALIPRQ